MIPAALALLPALFLAVSGQTGCPVNVTTLACGSTITGSTSGTSLLQFCGLNHHGLWCVHR
jgi:hypothetical protein